MSDRRIEYAPLADIARAPRNPKLHDDHGIQGSLGEFGMAEVPLVDERTGRLVAGHGRLDALTALHTAGAATPDGVQLADDGTWLVPVIRGWASRDDQHAEAYLLASNRLSERGGWDRSGLDQMLADLARADLDLAQVAGWDLGDLEDVLTAAEDVEALAAPVAGHTSPATGLVHSTVPATGAAYAETPEQEAARSDRIGAYEPRTPQGTAEMILVYGLDDRAEAQRLVAAGRDVLGTELKASEVVLRALRVLLAVLDERHRFEPVSMALFAKIAGATDLD